MRQRHSYHELFYHLVLHTKYRQSMFLNEEDEQLIIQLLCVKANQLDSYVEEAGTWYEHLHLMLRTGTTLAISKIYQQLKGFSAWSWNKRNPERFLKWGDGVYITTVSPQDNEKLRQYIRNQRLLHSKRNLIDAWESP